MGSQEGRGGDGGAEFSSLKKFKIPQRLSIPIGSL